MPGRLASIVISVLAAALVAALALGVHRVAELEAHERDLAGEIVRLDAAGAPPLSGERTLLAAELDAGDSVTFELCSGDAMDPAAWGAGASVEILFRTDEGADLVDRRALDAALLGEARHAAAGDGSCLVFDRAHLTVSGSYEVGLAWDAAPSFASVPLRARVLVRRPLTAGDGNQVFLVFALSILLVLGSALRPAAPAPAPDGLPRATGRVALAVGLTLLSMTAFSFLVPPGRTTGLLTGLGLAAVEIALALALARAPRADRIAWGRSDVGALVARIEKALAARSASDASVARARRAVEVLAALAWLVVVAPLAGIALRFAALESLASVPSTGEAPIEAFVALPSGMLSFALIAVVAPLAEEIFFRGLVYGTLVAEGSRARVALAFTGAWLLFGVVHLPQTWGNWGGLLAIVLAGLALTTLRALSRSTLVPALAHLVYNGLLAAIALAGAITNPS